MTQPDPTPAVPVRTPAMTAAPAPCARRRRARGFTLVELMVVIFIIGLLATVVIVNVLPSQDRAMAEKAKADLALIEQALEMYRLDNLAYPTTEQGLAALQQPPAGLANPERYRSGGYLRRLPADPWGSPYQYRAPGQSGPYDLFSLGADRQPGGEGEGADIVAGAQPAG